MPRMNGAATNHPNNCMMRSDKNDIVKSLNDDHKHK